MLNFLFGGRVPVCLRIFAFLSFPLVNTIAQNILQYYLKSSSYKKEKINASNTKIVWNDKISFVFEIIYLILCFFLSSLWSTIHLICFLFVEFKIFLFKNVFVYSISLSRDCFWVFFFCMRVRYILFLFIWDTVSQNAFHLHDSTVSL